MCQILPATDDESDWVQASEIFYMFFWGNTLILLICSVIRKLNDFRGDLSDISANTATLVQARCVDAMDIVRLPKKVQQCYNRVGNELGATFKLSGWNDF